jgi:hypothetical protein
MSFLATIIGIAAILYFCVVIVWGVVQVYRLSEPMRFGMRHLLVVMTALAVFLGAIAATVR